MAVKIYAEPFNPLQEIERYQSKFAQISESFGASSIFIGTMRNNNAGDNVLGMTLEHYPGMAEKYIQKIINEATTKWSLIKALVVHRVGNIMPGDSIVLVAIWSVHRGNAFDASRYIMEALKSRVPFWKKEYLQSNQHRWVQKNTDGYQ